MSKGPAGYLYSDQFARLEAARAYLTAAAEVLGCALQYETRNPEPSYLKREIANISMGLVTVVAQVDELMNSMHPNLLIEGGDKDTIWPPPAPTGAMRLEFKSPRVPVIPELADDDVISDDIMDT